MKEILRQISEFLRSSFLILLVLAASAMAIYRLTKLQIAAAEEESRQHVSETVYTQVIPATRGAIVDCNGKPVVSNKIGYNLVIEKAYFPTDNKAGNRVILKTANLLKEAGFRWNDSAPVTKVAPYVFLSSREEDADVMKEKLHLNPYATAQNCMEKLYADYEIDDSYTEQEKRLIAGVR